jgi:hypothetical protein
MKLDHEVETSFKASTTYKGEIIANSNKLHNLDLSLRIPASSKQLNNNNFGVEFSSGCTTYMTPQERGTMVPLLTLSLFSFQTHLSGFYNSYIEKAKLLLPPP